MAVDRLLIAKDMYYDTVGDLDQRVVEDGWTYYTHAVSGPSNSAALPERPPILLVIC